MFGAHIPELMIVLVIALIFFGPKKLPEIGGAVGKAIRGFKTEVSSISEHTVSLDEAHDAVQTAPVAVETSPMPAPPAGR